MDELNKEDKLKYGDADIFHVGYKFKSDEKCDPMIVCLENEEVTLNENEKDIVAPLTIRQKDNCKDGSRLFDWTSGKTTIEDLSLIFFRRISCSSNQTSYECTWRKIATWT